MQTFRKRLGLAIVLVAMAGSVSAQNKAFPLGQAITEPFVGCIYAQDAIDIIKAKTEVALTAKIQADLCRPVHWTITYRQLVLQEGDWSVYRGTVNGKDIFVPMFGWVGISNSI